MIMDITIKQGNLRVVKTGTILVVNNEETVITLDNNYIIKLNYVDEPKEKKQGLFAKAIEKGLLITLKNFNNPFGAATKQPIPVAITEEDNVFLSLSVVAMPEMAKIVTYGIYLGKKEDSNVGNTEQ